MLFAHASVAPEPGSEKFITAGCPVGWGVGVGEKVKIDDRWRIVIPARFRKHLKVGDELIVEDRGLEIVLRRVPREDLLREFREIKLFASEEMVGRSAERGKHRYGGRKV